MKLIQYRDAGMHTYTYFWISENNQVLSPYFDTKEQAENWAESQAEQFVHDTVKQN
jgi:hypothetical protein